jgi:hypothetical protein
MGLAEVLKSMGSEATGIAPSYRLMDQITGKTKPESGFGLNMDTVNWLADLINNTVGVAGPAYGAAKMAPGLGRVLAEEAQKMPMRLADQTGTVGNPRLTPKVIPNESGFGSKVEYMKGGNTVGSGQLRGDEITNVVVPEEFRRQGYGTEIMKDLMERGGKKGYPATEAGKKLMQKVGLADEIGIKKDLGEAWNKYDNTGEYTVRDLVNHVDQIISKYPSSKQTKKLSSGINKFEKELAYDLKLGGRGDLDAAEEVFADIVRKTLNY